jgi:hypothetical protein
MVLVYARTTSPFIKLFVSAALVPVGTVLLVDPPLLRASSGDPRVQRGPWDGSRAGCDSGPCWPPHLLGLQRPEAVRAPVRPPAPPAAYCRFQMSEDARIVSALKKFGTFSTTPVGSVAWAGVLRP